MRDFVVDRPEPVRGADLSLGRLGAALERLATMQGGWPPHPARAVRHLVLSPDEPGDLEAGVAQADDLADRGTDLLVLGASGDPAPGLVAAALLLDLEPVQAVGTASAPGWAQLAVAVRDGLRTTRSLVGDPAGLLAALGSPVLARATGLLAQSAARRTPVLLDGSAALAGAALLAERLAPGAPAWWLAGQLPPLPAARAALDDLGLVPLLDLGLDRPEGAALAHAVLGEAVELARG